MRGTRLDGILIEHDALTNMKKMLVINQCIGQKDYCVLVQVNASKHASSIKVASNSTKRKFQTQKKIQKELLMK